MKKFNFALDGILSYKNQMLEGVKAEYNKVLLEVTNQEEKIMNLRNQFQQNNLTYNTLKKNGMNVVEAVYYSNYLRDIEKTIMVEENQLKELKKIEIRKREKLVEAKIETSSIEKLKEKKHIEYNKEIAKIEEISIEELVSSKRFSK